MNGPKTGGGSKILLVLVFLMPLAAPAQGKRNTSRSAGNPQSLLLGCTVDASNQPTCNIPAAWTLVIAEGFESGNVTSKESYLGDITATFGHSGSHSLHMLVSFDQATPQWNYNQGNLGSFSAVYLSFYEYLDSNAAINDEMGIANLTIHDSSGNLAQELFIDRLGSSFNTFTPSIVIEPQSATTGVTEADYGPAPNIRAGTWHQWEIYWQPNAEGRSNGLIQIYENGQLRYSLGNHNFNKNVPMTNAQVFAGGIYTKLIWTDNGKLPPSGTCVALGNGLGFDVGGTLAKLGSICPPSAPSFNRYLDDVILLKR
jgi:hypothetical protein